MVLKELIFKFVLLEGAVVFKRTDFLTVCTFGGCGGLEELIFKFVLLEGVVVLKELIFNSLYFGGCCGLERNNF